MMKVGKLTHDMKKLILLLFIPLVFTCSSDPNIVNLNSEIGDIEGGGIVFSANTGGGGMIVTMQDIGIGNWYEAEYMVEINSTGGNNDWSLPSILQLQQIYDSVGQGGGNIAGFENSRYWSSTETTYGYYAFDFGTGQTINNLYPSANARVRAVRSF